MHNPHHELDITYRKLIPEDSNKYRLIRLASLKAHPESFGSDYEAQKSMPKLMFQKAIEQPYDDRFVIGAFHQARMIGITGFIPFVFEKKEALRDTGSIIQIYVDPDFRGHKVGLNLMARVVEEAFKLPFIQRIQLGVTRDNYSAINLYQQVGFRTLDQGDETFGIPEPGGFKMVLYRSE